MAEHAASLQSSTGAGGPRSGGDLISLLSERVQSLVERFRATKNHVAQLDGLLSERDQQIGELTRQLEQAREVRDKVQQRIDNLVTQVERLEKADA